MTVMRKINPALHLMCLFALLVSATGCIKEDLDDCEDTFTLKVVAYDQHTDQVYAEDVVTCVTLYMFDTASRYFNHIDARVGQTVTVKAPKGEDVHIVVWGNLNGNQSKIQPKCGDLKETLSISLMPHSTRAVTHCVSPDDLFRGEKNILNTNRQGEEIIDIYRAVGSMAITVRGIKEYVGDKNDANYSAVIRQTCSAIDFNGKYVGEKTAAYRPAGTFGTYNGRSELTFPAFNMIPEDEEVCIDLYHGAHLIGTFHQQPDATPVTVQCGKLTNVLIDFGAAVSVSISLTDWGKEELWKEF